MSVCQALTAAGQVKDASTLRARTAVREKPAVARDMSWLTPTPAKVNLKPYLILNFIVLHAKVI